MKLFAHPKRYLFLAAVSLLFASQAVLAQDPPTTPAVPQGEAPAGFPGRAGAQPEIRPYERVITKDAKSDDGIFTVHKIKDKVYYEIPKSELNKEFLWVTQIAKTTIGVGYGGQAVGNRVVRWERNGNRILLRNINYTVIADPKLPIAQAVKAANNDAIIQSFWIEAIGKDEAPVIEVTRLFTSEITEFSARTRLRARGFDATRSFLDRVASYPTNIEAEATHTFTNPPDTGGLGAATPPNPFLGAGMGTGSASIVVHFSMVKLPENPMMPRLFDERVGYFNIDKTDYGQDEQRAPQRSYITRWRLEKKDPNAELSEPVKPIVYYVDAATPTKWVKYIKQGIEDWQPAFEAAGFKNAIIAKEAPKDDPDWSPEDARYSVVRWLPSTIENASGPHIHDPRTGEILESDIQFYHNVMNLSRDWYFTQVGPLDPRAQKLPFPDELMGELIRYVAAHEVGHTLGFQHNMKASSLYPLEKVRDAEWVKKMGHTPTLMDYSRFNYVAQPEDKIAIEDLIPKIGPYDKWATMWGYKPIPSAKTSEEERKTLNEWAREQDKTPYLRFSTANARGTDPGDQTEAVGDADAVAATTLGVKNLKRVADMLLTATSTSNGDPYNDLNELYGRMLGQWRLEMNHVVTIVGGSNSQQKHVGQDGVLFTPVPRARQQGAVKFLVENAFATPTWMIRPEILRRLEPNGVLDRIKSTQVGLLSSLLNPIRISRLTEQEAVDGNAYTPVEFLGDLRKGVFSELAGTGAIKVDAFRRNLQRGYLDLMADRLNGRAAVTDDARPLLRGELQALSADIARTQARATDRTTQLHLQDIKDQIAKILDPKFQPAAPAANPLGALFGRFTEEQLDELNRLICWPDYSIKLQK